MLKSILDDMKPKQREALFCNVRQNSVIALDWLDFTKEKQDQDGKFNLDSQSKAHLKTLLDVVKFYGIDINPPFKAAGRRGHLYESSVMRESVSKMVFTRDDSINKPAAVERLDFLFEMGAKVDIPTKAMVLADDFSNELLPTIKWFKDKGLASPHDWLEAKEHKYASAQSVALIQGYMAKSAIDEMTSPEKSRKASPT